MGRAQGVDSVGVVNGIFCGWLALYKKSIGLILVSTICWSLFSLLLAERLFHVDST